MTDCQPQILTGHFKLLHNVRDAIWQEFLMAKSEVRACLENYSATDVEAIARLDAARQRKARAERMGWG